MSKLEEQIECCRKVWANVAKEHGWYTEPFYIQIFLDSNNEIEDSVAHRGLTQDIIIRSE